MLDLLGDRKSADILDVRDNHGTTALHFACEFNFADIVKMLVSNGASHKIQNDAGLFALHTAAKKGRQSLEILLALPDCIAIDTRDTEGLSALLIACLHGNDAAASALLEKGADPLVVDLEGMGVVHACVEAGDARLLKLIVDKADVRCRDKGGSEPIHVAASNGNVGCLEVLMTCEKIDLNAVDGESRTALHLACVGGHALFVETLVKDKRVDVNVVNSAGCLKQSGCKKINSKISFFSVSSKIKLLCIWQVRTANLTL
jgi:ankyrin repeat protein